MQILGLFVFLLVVSADPTSSFQPATSSPHLATSSRRMGWGDSGWRWGSAIGEAHNIAITTRHKFGTEATRRTYIHNLGKASSLCDDDIEELKMVLALRFQRAAREGKDGNGRGWNIMCNMAECKYEGEGISLLIEDLQACVEHLPSDLMATAALKSEGPSPSLPAVAAQCLAGTDFIRIGL